MDTDGPLATLRLVADRLDPRIANRILLSGVGLSDVRSKPGVWMLTTEGYNSPWPQDHLAELTGLLSKHLSSVREAFPGVTANFSLLVFDPNFTTQSLPENILSAATEMGTFTLELPTFHKEFVYTDSHTMQEFAA